MSATIYVHVGPNAISKLFTMIMTAFWGSEKLTLTKTPKLASAAPPIVMGSTMVTKTVCAKHQTWNTGAVGVHEFRTVSAFPFAIFCLALLQLPF